MKIFNYVDFDPANKQHRNDWLRFKLSGKWPDEYRFKLDPMFNNVPVMMNHKLFEYYFNNDKGITEENKKNLRTTFTEYNSTARLV